MPVISFVSAPLDAAKKRRLIELFTQHTAEVAGVPTQSVVVLFHDLPADSIGTGGKVLSDLCAERRST